jgi:hypothetical protein
MKKLISLMIGLGLVLTVAAPIFAQDTTKSDTGKKKGGKKKKSDTTKKDGGSSH